MSMEEPTSNGDGLSPLRAKRNAPPLVAVIEDDGAIRETLRTLLEDAGYAVIEAKDGQAGYDILCQSAKRLIAIIDHKMPRMDGCDLLHLVENDAHLRARHTFIFVTASPKRAEEDCGDTLEELDIPMVAKPFHIDEVLDAVAEAAGRIAQPVPAGEGMQSPPSV